MHRMPTLLGEHPAGPALRAPAGKTASLGATGEPHEENPMPTRRQILMDNPARLYSF